MPYTTNEIRVGLAIHFTAPEHITLETLVRVSSNTPVTGPHYFLCVEIQGAKSLWVPMFSDQGTKQGKLAAAEKTGPGGSQWLGDSYFYTNQSWSIPLDIAA